MRFSHEFIDEIKYRCDIYDVISSYVNLKRAGSNYTGLCPFHSEKTPSFTVFPSTSSFYCFGCGAGGDVITFVMKAENLDYAEAVETLAARAGIPLPAASTAEETQQKKRKRLLEMHREAARFFHRSLLNADLGARARSYLQTRGIQKHAVTHFGLGYAPNEFYALTDYLRSLGYTEEEMVSGSLCYRSKKNNRVFDAFRNRVMFPLIDTGGDVIGFAGRAIDHVDETTRKYINSSDTPIFKKSRFIYALNYARKHSRDYMILCEGPMDTIALHMAGFEMAVATQGTAITDEHARILSKYTKRVILAYDSDAAGQNASKKAIRLLGNVGMDVQLLQIQGAKDPDEYIHKFGADKFRVLLQKSVGDQEFLLSSTLSKYDLQKAEERGRAAREIATMIAQNPSAVQREIFAGKAADTLGVSKSALLDDIRHERSKQAKQTHKQFVQTQVRQMQGISDRINPDAAKNRRSARAEEQILGILLATPELCASVFSPGNDGLALTTEDFFTAFHKKLFALINDQFEKDGKFDLSYLGQELQEQEMGRAVQLKMKRDGLQNDESVLLENIAALHQANRQYRQKQEKNIDMQELSQLLAEKRQNKPLEQSENAGKDKKNGKTE